MLTMVVSGRAQAREACSCTASTRMQRRSLERLFIMLASWKAVKVWVKGENKKGTQRRSMEELLVDGGVTGHVCVLTSRQGAAAAVTVVWKAVLLFVEQTEVPDLSDLSQIQILDY